MSHTKTFAGTSYTIPDSGDRGWSALTTYLDALADYAQTNRNQKWEAVGSTTTPYAVLTTDTYIGMNVSSASAVTLPAGTTGRLLLIADESNNASVNNITLTPSGGNTIAGAASYVMTGNNQAIGIIFRNGDWKLFANFSTNAITESSTNTFTNKTLLDSTTYIADQGDTTKKFQFQASGITTATTRTLTVPDADLTIVGTATTQTLTNKTLTAPVITGATTISDAGFIVDDADATKKISIQASGITTGTTRTITMGDRDINLGALVNADVSSSAAIAVTKLAYGTANQVLGTNAAANANEFKTLSVGTTGTDFAIAHSAGAVAFNLPDASTSNRGVVTTAAQSFTGLKKMEGGVIPIGVIAANDSNVTFTNTDNRIQISTPTAARTHTLPTTSIKAGEIFEFFNQATNSSYIITLNASGGTTVDYVVAKGYLKVIALQDTPTTNAHWKVLYASSDYVSFTPTATSFGSITTATGFLRRQGSEMHLECTFTSGTVAAAFGGITVPLSLNIDSAKISKAVTAGATTGSPVVGFSGAENLGYGGLLLACTTSSTTLIYQGGLFSGGAGYGNCATNISSIRGSSQVCTFNATIPISGWNG